MVKLVPIDQVHPSNDNPRRKIGNVEELAVSIKSMGLLQSLVVAPNGDGYELIAGHRRLEACKVAGLEEVEVIIREHLDTDIKRREARLVENLQREDLSPLEEAHAFKSLVELGRSQRELSDMIGTPQSQISKRVNLLELPEDVQDKLDAGKLSLTEANMLLPLRTYPDRIEKVFKNVSQYSPLDRCIQSELRDLKAEVQLEKDIKEATGKGIGTLTIKEYQDLPRDTATQLHPDSIDLEAHEREVCHALLISFNKQLYPICTDVARHELAGDSPVKWNDQEDGDPGDLVTVGQREADQARRRAEEAEEEKRELAIEEAQARRLTFIQELIQGPATGVPPSTYGLVVRGQIFNPESNLDQAAEWLEIPIDSDGYDYPEFTDHLDAHPERAGKVALAIAISCFEPLRGPGSYQIEHNADAAARHFAANADYIGFLQELGYVPSDIELELITPPAMDPEHEPVHDIAATNGDSPGITPGEPIEVAPDGSLSEPISSDDGEDKGLIDRVRDVFQKTGAEV